MLIVVELMGIMKRDIFNPASFPLESDKLNYLWLVKFFSSYVAANYKHQKALHTKKRVRFESDAATSEEATEAKLDIASIAVTMELVDFANVLRYCQQYVEEKNWLALPIVVGALKEMVLQFRLILINLH